MRVVFALIGLTVLWTVNAVAQSSISKRDAKISAELTQLEKDIGEANIRRDKAFFERIEADEFIFTDSVGGLTTKAEDVASLDKPSGEFKLASYEVDDVQVRIYGNTAVVTGRAATVSKGKERETTSRSRFTDVFVRRGGQWQIVAGHSSRIREPQK
ncbi:MAG: nuclear transport factor 2 family protein [Acidobacteriota bacterium]